MFQYFHKFVGKFAFSLTKFGLSLMEICTQILMKAILGNQNGIADTKMLFSRLASVQEQRLPCAATANDGRLSPSSSETPPVTPTSAQHGKVCFSAVVCLFMYNLHVDVVLNQFIYERI